MAGYAYPDSSLQWFNGSEPIDVLSPRHRVEYREGNRRVQNGGDDRVKSRISSLEILEPELADSGPYTCMIVGTAISADVNLTVLQVDGKLMVGLAAA